MTVFCPEFKEGDRTVLPIVLSSMISFSFFRLGLYNKNNLFSLLLELKKPILVKIEFDSTGKRDSGIS